MTSCPIRSQPRTAPRYPHVDTSFDTSLGWQGLRIPVMIMERGGGKMSVSHLGKEAQPLEVNIYY